MAEFLDKMSVNTAITNNTKMDLSHQHITTANFMQLNPVLCKEMVPGEKCSVNMMTAARLQALAVPTFGRANIKERAFFVPMRTIFRGWNDFITDTFHVYSGANTTIDNKLPGDITVSGNHVPTISNAVLAQFFLDNYAVLVGSGSGMVVSETVNNDSAHANPSDGEYDIIGYSTTNTSTYQGTPTCYIKLTREGKQCLKILESLGYKIVWDTRNEDVYSAMPLLAFAKVYCDWYFPNQYVNTGIYVDIMGLLNYDGGVQLTLTTSNLQKLLGWTSYVNYDADYFVNAWDNPVAPSVGVFSSFNIPDITTLNSASSSFGSNGVWRFGTSNYVDNFSIDNSATTNGTPVSVMDYGSSATTLNSKRVGMTISEYQHTALKALTDYMKRHQLVGARALDRYLARFGKSLAAEKMNRSNYIGSKLVPLQIGDVTSTSNSSALSTTGGLGQFAGKGQAFEKSFTFDWSTDEFGFLIVTTSIVPAAGIYQGLDRKVMHINKTDFWTPEFDNLGVQAISTRELYNNYTYANLSTPASSYMSWNTYVFGFAPRYGEYKFAKDQLTGDFVLNSTQPVEMNAAENAWHLFRTFDEKNFWTGTTYSFGQLVHDRGFMQGIRDGWKYNRIFSYTEPVYLPDPITCIYDFQMVSFAPMKPLYETYDFEDKGQKIQEQAGGVKLN